MAGLPLKLRQASDGAPKTVSLSTLGTVFLLTGAVTISESLLYFGYNHYTILAYTILLVVLSLTPLFAPWDAPVYLSFALIPAFRLVNLAMPVFTDLTLFWLPLVYGPFLPVVVYLGRRTAVGNRGRAGAEAGPGSLGIDQGLPWWLGGTRGGKLRRLLRRGWVALVPPADASTLRAAGHWIARGLFVALLLTGLLALLGALFGVTVYLAEIEYDILRPGPLIPSLEPIQLAVLVVTMILFVGFVEELLFRGVLQTVLERRLGHLPGLLLASVIFAMMHSGHGVSAELAFAGGVGLLFGIIYDVTDSLALVAVMNGLLNTFVFGVIPLDGGSSLDLIQTLLRQFL